MFLMSRICVVEHINIKHMKRVLFKLQKTNHRQHIKLSDTALYMRHWNKRGVKKARYWPSSFSAFSWTETQSRFHKISRRKRTKELFSSKKKKIIVSDYCIRSRWKAKKKNYPFVYFFTNFPFCNGWHHYYFFNYRCLQIKIRWFYKWNSNIEVRLQFTLVYWSMSPNVWWVALNVDRCCF